jgi:tetratricopeptide (TPR) repeat protein
MSRLRGSYLVLAAVLIAGAIGIGCGKPKNVVPVDSGNPLIPAGRLGVVDDPDDLDAVQLPAKKLQPIVFLEPTVLPPEEPFTPYNIIHHELFRQAFLIAARDELGLTTRDALFRELAPPDLPAENRMYVAGALPRDKRMTVEVAEGPPDARKPIWGKEGFPNGFEGPMDLPVVLTAAEKLSRGRFVKALQKAGFDGRANKVNATATVPPAAEKLMDEMSFPAQFAAARLLHSSIREQGESPALIAALSRAYANLGLLTECHWNHMHKGFKARALLYAQRLVSANASSPSVVWQRAYAEALAGMHQSALDDLQTAAKLNNDAKVERPAWVDVIDAYCHFDTTQLEKVAADAAHGRLAHLLSFITVEDRRFKLLTMRAAEKALKVCPDCPRILGALAHQGWMEGSLDKYVDRLPKSLAKLPDLPPEVSRDMKGDVKEPQLLWTLTEAGRALPGGEPSWTLLARMMQEERFDQVCHHLAFLQFTLAVDPSDAVPAALPLVTDHPYKTYVESFVDRKRTPGEVIGLLERLPWNQFDWRSPSVIWSAVSASEHFGHRMGVNAGRHADILYHDLSMRVQWSNHPDFVHLLMVSPFAPMARAGQIREPFKAIQDKVDAWEKESQHPSVQQALGKQYLQMKRYADAQRCFKRAVELSPEAELYRQLAEAYKEDKKMDQWLATLEESLKYEDPGLEHARTRETIANEFMLKGDYKRALPYAEAAGGTFSEWGLRCAGLCYEGLGDWKKAEEQMKAIAGRYDDAYQEWFFWCARTGKGDIQAAREQLEKQLAELGRQRTENDLMVAGGYHLITGKTREALEAFRELANNRRIEWGQMMVALLHDSLGEQEQCSRSLDAIPPDFVRFKPVAKVLSDSRVRGEPGRVDTAALEKVLEEMRNRVANTPKELRRHVSEVPVYYFVGRYLELRGQKAEARGYYKRCIDGYISKNFLLPTLAGARLQALAAKQ